MHCKNRCPSGMAWAVNPAKPLVRWFRRLLSSKVIHRQGSISPNTQEWQVLEQKILLWPLAGMTGTPMSSYLIFCTTAIQRWDTETVCQEHPSPRCFSPGGMYTAMTTPLLHVYICWLHLVTGTGGESFISTSCLDVWDELIGSLQVFTPREAQDNADTCDSWRQGFKTGIGVTVGRGWGRKELGHSPRGLTITLHSVNFQSHILLGTALESSLYKTVSGWDKWQEQEVSAAAEQENKEHLWQG